MTDDEKMDTLMEKHAAKTAKPSENHRGPLTDVADMWQLDDRDALFICPQCGNQRTGKVFKSWWAMAEKRGETNPWWKSLCTTCSEKVQEAAKPPARKVSEALELELPNTERGTFEDE